jgi:molybdopterin-guanine dinucleotide biosynthesis protein A
VIDGFVLAGGRSRRMGFDKARAPWDGLPMALAVRAGLRSVCARVALVRRGDDGLPWPLPEGGVAEVVWERVDAEEHPLWGVVTALRAARTELVAVAPCDVPELRSWPALVRSAPCVAWDGARIQGLVGVLPRSLADRAEQLARAGAPAHHLVTDLPRVELPAAELRDHDDPSTIRSPVEALLARIPVDDPVARARIAAGERGRLAARGVLDPPRSAPPSVRGPHEP